MALNPNHVISLYKNDHTVQQIAELCGVSTYPIAQILKQAGCRKPNRFKSLPYALYEQVSNKDYFIEAVSDCVSKIDIQEKLGLNYDMVVSLCDMHGVKMPNSATARSLRNRKKATVEFNRDDFIRMYYTESLSIDDISRQMGVSAGYLRKTAVAVWGLTLNKSNITKLSPQYKELIADDDRFSEVVNAYTLTQVSQMFSVNISTVSAEVKRRGITLPFRTRSAGEQEVADYVSALVRDGEVELNVRDKIHPYELDIYIPSKRIAIEYCGLYWHSDAQQPDKLYHQRKLDLCAANNITLITIFEDEWKNRNKCCREKLSSLLGNDTRPRIAARLCEVTTVTASEKKVFLNEHHIQGNDVSAIWLGLKHQGELVAVMTFATPSRVRQSKKSMATEGLWELNRYATSVHVAGGAGKLLAYFKRNYGWRQIYSYADRRWSTGRMYHTLGFELEAISPPNYWYISKRCDIREYRYTYAKYKLVEQGYDPSLTEFEIMASRGYHKIWDCGMLKFSLSNIE